MAILDRLLKLRERQMVNNKKKSLLYFKRDRFYDLYWEIKRLTHPCFDMPQVVWDFWLYKIMPQFLDGNEIQILGYKIRALER